MPPLRRCCWAVLLVAWPSLPWCLHVPLDSTRRRLLASFLGLSTPVSVAANARPDATDWAGAFAAKNAANAADGCIRSIAKKYVEMMPDSAPSFLRLAFHDAATKRGDGQGPNGSIRFELERNENLGPSLQRALRAIEEMVNMCHVSWADAIAVSGAAVVEAMGGPAVVVSLGRRDAGALRDYFLQLGLDDEELVALMGAHTVGRWTSLLGVPDECMAKEGLAWWRCTREQGQRLPFTSHPTVFNNEYFKDVLEFERRQQMPRPAKRFKDRVDSEKLPPLYLLPSDLGLLYDEGLHQVVKTFATDQAAFFAAFARVAGPNWADRRSTGPGASQSSKLEILV
ncbi:unnamed protein product [Durusdinium trenchii]|uniref:Plant heme peroxidase family profile domain-containing protein n=1 Tax=Durusdinium trenchii TaxID=1381693 RepID=A0ABP0PWI8_9DINO